MIHLFHWELLENSHLLVVKLMGDRLALLSKPVITQQKELSTDYLPVRGKPKNCLRTIYDLIRPLCHQVVWLLLGLRYRFGNLQTTSLLRDITQLYSICAESSCNLLQSGPTKLQPPLFVGEQLVWFFIYSVTGA